MPSKSTIEYWKRKQAGTLSPTEKRGTPEYFKVKYWTTLNQRTVNGAHPVLSARNKRYMEMGVRLEMTKAEFFTWVDSTWTVIDALYKAGETPSIDRIRNTGHYSLDNIQILDLRTNMGKDRNKPLVAIDSNGNVKRYPNARTPGSDGFDYRGISKAAITGCCYKDCLWLFA